LISLAVAGAAHAEGLREQRAALEQRLSTQRLALGALKDEKTSVLGVVDLLQHFARDAGVRERAAKGELALLQRRLAEADAEQRLAEGLARSLSARLAPRLEAMYRLTRRSTLSVMLSASDFASMVWRSRALGTVLQADLALLRDTQEVLAYQREARDRIEAMKATYGDRVLALEGQRAFAAQEREELVDMLDGLQANASQRVRLIKELEGAERHLSKLIEQMETSAQSAFGRLKGHLPFPSQGIVEVGFGRIVNPRFNTITVQKGLDIRVQAGAPVHAVAPGKVVYASWLRGYGNILILDHGSGFHTLMAHLQDFSIDVGAEVKAGDVLGTVGDTGSLKGAYLYFELREAGQAVDPAEWLAEAAGR
jgi:septal ring factor EnvC (AmiA/AmiB activator)